MLLAAILPAHWLKTQSSRLPGKKLKNASVGRILIERPAKNARITIFSARPGVVIGKKGEDIEVLRPNSRN